MLLSILHTTLLDSSSAKAIFLLSTTLLMFWLLILFGRIIKKYRGIAATGAMFVNALVAFALFFEVGNNEYHQFGVRWIDVIDFKVDFGVGIDSLSALFACIVCFISFLVHLFSIEYLRGDKNLEKYFAYLSLFTFAMLGIIFSGNMFQLFVFWELVGFSSYLLIGFWYENNAAVQANKKAFLVNRVGDVGFLFGITIIYSLCNTLQISDIQLFIQESVISETLDFDYLVSGNVISKGWLIVAALGISSGALAKSAQFPFSSWLPNAMEGPTPVSALIHAATMVAAGIYLLARFSFILPDFVLTFLAILGVITSFLAAYSAFSQTDIKRVLAYSTISQLGYMVMAIGIKSYESAMFHLLTHAFFKAALFLCAGAIIHSLHKLDTAYGIKKLYPDFDEQNMRQMGGMRHKTPFIFWIYTIALCGIIGVPFFTGFLSKDAILLNAFDWADHKGGFAFLIPILALSTVAMTSFYMIRQYLLVFFGENRMSDTVTNAPKGIQSFITKEKLEASLLMKISPCILAVLTFFPVFSFNPFDAKDSWVFKKLPHFDYLDRTSIPHLFSHSIVSLLSISMMFFGAYMAYQLFEKGKMAAFKQGVKSNDTLYNLSFHFWYIEACIQKLIVLPTIYISKMTSRLDKNVIDKIPEVFLYLNLQVSTLCANFDIKIINGFVQVLGTSTIIFAKTLAWVDKNMIDGFVNLLGWLGIKIGSFAKVIHRAKFQSQVIWSFLMLILLVVIIYWIK